ncbi:substrate-binding domain-containing protein [Arenibacter palladensis]|uniref:substrate-binding domain-containing protein n=1 Tax=Arenibacter palladensis TaxID=237373 RepID=UPI0026E3F22B|nr:substrate-binding domain-containing protein [Arenibacter palladensis]MDO6602846.1 substrate-binding domain-containing protein [Arenibacter palladensis]
MLCSCSNIKSKDKIYIGFSQAMSNDDWRRSMNEAMKLQASLDHDVELIICDANNEVQKQISQIDQLIKDSVDIIIVSPILSKPITPIVQKAIDSKIPVLVVDRKTENETYTAYLGADNIEVGRIAANRIIASNSKDSINVVEITGLVGSSPAEERSLGFRKVIDGQPNIKIIETIGGNWESESIEENFKNLLNNSASVDYVFAHNDRMARGVWQVARSLGKENRIRIIGVDGLNTLNGGIQLVKDGVLEATILYPSGGEEAIKLAVEIVKNESFAKNNILTTTVIDKFNVNIMKDQYDKIYEQRAQIENQLEAIGQQQEKYYAQNNLLKVTMGLLAIIFSLALYSIYSIFTIRKKNRQLELTTNKVIVQRGQIEKIAQEVKESNEAKFNLYTGLSHEFKTPITLILSSIESILDTAKVKGIGIMSEVELIYNNSNRLLRLVNQLLDFRKLEDRKFTLRVSKTNLYTFSNTIFKDFEREAKKRNINFTIECNDEALDVYIDRNLMDKVYFNLLSNAFKFTPDNGSISISIINVFEKNIVKVYFSDTGIGIPKSEIENVFQPFFKGSNNRKNSSGMGLHLSKELVELHKGSVVVRSKQGAEFIITLFKGQGHFDENEVMLENDMVDPNQLDFGSDYFDHESYFMENEDSNSEKYSLLIIEDNSDLLLFLKNKLQIEYEIYISNGSDATEKAFEVIPDIIICDVNLPYQTGFEVCAILKRDWRTSHIPTIILTAMGGKESYLEGLQAGADLYLTKPFSYSVLMQSIQSLLFNREKLRYYYTNSINKLDAVSSFNNVEQEFLDRLNRLIKNNLDNSEFNVEQLAVDLAISRMQLYRKVKATLGINVSDYLNNFRLDKAKQLLEKTDLTVSEIAYKTGFSSPNYFSTVFKKKYGAPPNSIRI